FQQASESVRTKLDAADRSKANVLKDVIAQASNQIQTEIRDASAIYGSARARVLAVHQSGRLNEPQLFDFARAGQFDEATIAISILADLPIGVVERAVANRRTEQILVLAKAIGMGWETTKAILLLQAGTKGSSTDEIEQCRATYMRLQPDTAKKAIQFYRLRERATSSN